MFIKVDTKSAVPIYSQIIEQIKYSIASKSLKSGDKLPSIRELAGQLVINPNTVIKAYTELEREGIIATKKGQGSFVSDAPVTMIKSERVKIITNLLDKVIVQAIQLGIAHDDFLKTASKEFKSFMEISDKDKEK